jgi:CubicO group peptidase (beta-lactamase class C family)
MAFYQSSNEPNFKVKDPILRITNDIRVINEEIIQLQEELGAGQTISPNVLSNIAPQLSSYVFGTKNGVPHKGGFVYGGNFKSNQEFFLGTGTANSSGLRWSEDTVYSWASSGKMLTGLTCAKMIEEGLIKPLDKIYTYDNQFTGAGYYWASITGTNPSLFPTPGGFTGTVASFNLQDVTISDLIHMNVGIIDDFFVVPNAILGWTQSYAAIYQSQDLISMAAGVESYKYFQSLATTGTNAIGFVSKFYNGEAGPVDVATVITDAIQYVKNQSITCLYPPQKKYNNQYPYLTRALPSTYDTSYILLGYIIDKALRANGYTNLSQYVREKFFIPLEMNHSYIGLQDTVSPSDQLLAAENSWRRSIAVGSIPFDLGGNPQPFNLLNAVTWPSYGCDAGYATAALVAYGQGNVAGPLVWDSDYPNDGLSRVGNIFYSFSGSPSNYTLGNAPLISSIRDFGKFLKFIGSKGYTPSGKRLIATETWNYFISPKISSLSGLSPFSLLDNDVNDSQYSAFAMGILRVNRDITNTTNYGFDETTLYFDGATGNTYYIDFYTGNWLVFGVPEFGLSTGVLDIQAVGSPAVGRTLTSDFLVKMIKP